MGLNRKKSRYVSFDELAKPSATDHVELMPAGVDVTSSEPVQLPSDDIVEELLSGDEVLQGSFDDVASDVAQRLLDIEAHVSQARLHIHNALIEDPLSREGDAVVDFDDGGDTLGEVADLVAAPASMPDPDESHAPLGKAEFVRYLMDDIDETDVESIEKSFFEESPISIEENMRQADVVHARQQKNAFVFALIALLLVIGIGLVVFGLASLSSAGGAAISGEVGKVESSQERDSEEQPDPPTKYEPDVADASKDSSARFPEPSPPTDVDQAEPSVEDASDIVEPSKEDLEPSPRYDMQTTHQGGA